MTAAICNYFISCCHLHVTVFSDQVVAESTEIIKEDPRSYDTDPDQQHNQRSMANFEVMLEQHGDGSRPIPYDGIFQPVFDDDVLLRTNGDLRYEASPRNGLGWGDRFPDDFRLSQTRKIHSPEYFELSQTLSTIKDRYVRQWVKPAEDFDDKTSNLDVFLFHARKAAGTTMRRTVGALCKAKGYTLKVAEGVNINSNDHKDYFGDSDKDRPLSVISIRDPVARAESLVRMNKHSAEFTSSTLLQEIHALNCKSEPKSATTLHIGMWNCAQEFYVKSLIGTESKSPADSDWKSVSDADLEKAKARLANFDVIVVTDWLKYPEMSQYLSKAFGASPSIPFGHENQAAVADYPRELNKPERQILIDYNKQDYKLFEFAKELSLARMHQAGFKSFVPPGYAKDAQTPVYNANLSPAGNLKTLPSISKFL